MIPVPEINEIMRGYLDRTDRKRPIWADYEAAYEGRAWRHHGQFLRRSRIPSAAVHGGPEDPLPFKVEVNLLRPHINRIIAQQRASRVRMQAKPPSVWTPRKGRPKEIPPGSAQAVAAVAEDFLQSRDFDAVREHATRLAAMYGAAAYKMGSASPGEDHERELMDTVAVDALPPWEAGWDEYHPGQHAKRYMFHLRQQDEAWIAANLPDSAVEDVEPVALVDFLRSGYRQDDETELDKGYYWVLEFYDLAAKVRRWFIGEGESRSGMTFTEVLSEEWPYYKPMIFPVVIEPLPHQPGNGLSIIDGLFQKAMERNLLLTTAANAFRHDAARKRAYRKDLLGDENLEEMTNSYDAQWVAVEPDEDGRAVPWEEVFYNIPTAPMPQTFRDYMAILQLSTSEEQPSSGIQQGNQGSYLTATESSLLAQFGEQNTGVTLGAELRASSMVAEGVITVLHGVLEERGVRALMVLVGTAPKRIPRDILAMPWRMSPAEANTSPARLAQARAELVTAQPILMELAVTAAGGPPPPPPEPGPNGEPPAPVDPNLPSVRPEVMEVAKRMYDWMGQALGLPEDTRWAVIESAVAEQAEEEPDDENKADRVLELLEKARVTEDDNPFALPPESFQNNFPQLPGIEGLLAGGGGLPGGGAPQTSPPIPEA